MEDLCQRIPHVCAKIFGLVDDQSLIKCKKASKIIYYVLENERFFWIRIIQAHEGRLQDSWKKVVVKTQLAIIKEFAASVQQYFRGTNHSNLSPLCIAASVCNSELCKYVAARTEDYKNEDNIQTAIADGYKYESFKLVLENVQNKNPRGYLGETPLHQAAREGCFEICNLIIENVAEKNPKDDKGKTPLHHAAEQGYFELCKLIINSVDEKNPGDEEGETPFHKAAEEGHIEICKLFIEILHNKNPRDEYLTDYTTSLCC